MKAIVHSKVLQARNGIGMGSHPFGSDRQDVGHFFIGKKRRRVCRREVARLRMRMDQEFLRYGWPAGAGARNGGLNIRG